ncbi:hydantoinase/oxoprolinase family protein [Flagellatimonas centrodinii]|uniref:hydantoinase/oxoprolinase family protein n=1 Tax=Flagellatimonas centrodinii TaxID=2806210 RepID=UPI001FFAEAC0|nr:hydantoinase/oxoprolinase family protein [Flagellatimonas centrodinii]ULQ45287.1 hydantoinase/oxoprolinase family protein [Flagellatimonas centrodinii]
MGKLINIDNGGTLTDICVMDGAQVYRTKTLTTPFDLSKCFFEGLVKVSSQIYGKSDIVSLLSSTDHIRYSTTQGTNALVERKGPRLGLVLGGTLSAAGFEDDPLHTALFADLVGERIATLDAGLDDAAIEPALVDAVNRLASAGANRVVIAHGGPDRLAAEIRLKKILLRKFPQHLLGAVPILYSHEVVQDDNDVRRTWTALFNAFLHPAMERFLYNAEHKLRTHKAQNPLLIFRNDGHSARVAKTIALKTYSSGPRGGMEGARALAAHLGLQHLVSIDIGGTTTDIGEVRDNSVREDARGQVEGVEVSFPLCNVVSVGVGGSSVIRARGQAIQVGPESVGSAPGPACFGLGGTEATITDAFLLAGLLDPASYFGGELKIDAERARKAIATHVGEPLGLDVDVAAAQMEAAWVEKVAAGIRAFTTVTPDTTLAAFGGAGPFVVCKVAEAVGASRVLIPGLAAVFSAFGLGFSDIAHLCEAPLDDSADLDAVRQDLLKRAERGMYGEGFALSECTLEWRVRISGADRDDCLPLGDAVPAAASGETRTLQLQVTRAIAQPQLRGRFNGTQVAPRSDVRRRVRVGDAHADLPLYRVEAQPAGARAAGPAVLEEAFFTCRIDAGWSFEVSDAGDVLLTRE